MVESSTPVRNHILLPFLRPTAQSRTHAEPAADTIIIDGSPLVNSLPPRSSRTFEDYAVLDVPPNTSVLYQVQGRNLWKNISSCDVRMVMPAGDMNTIIPFTILCHVAELMWITDHIRWVYIQNVQIWLTFHLCWNTIYNKCFCCNYPVFYVYIFIRSVRNGIKKLWRSVRVVNLTST